LARFCVAQPWQIVRVKRVTDFIETTAAGATKHLEKLVASTWRSKLPAK